MFNRSIRVAASLLALGLVTGCGPTGEPPQGSAVPNAKADIPDIQAMFHRPDGRFDVYCADGSQEIVTVADILSGQVCSSCQPTTCEATQTACGEIGDGCGGTLSCGECQAPAMCVDGTCVAPSTGIDIFAAAAGASLTQSEAAALFAPGAAQAALGGFAFGQRTRACTQVTGCGPWTLKTNAHFVGRSRAGTGGWYETPETSDMPTGFIDGSLTLKIADGKIVLEVRASRNTLYAEKCVLDGSTACQLNTRTTQCYWRADGTRNCWSFASQVSSSVGGGVSLSPVVGADHVVAHTPIYKGKAGDDGSYAETQYALFGYTSAGQRVSLAIEDGALIATPTP